MKMFLTLLFVGLASTYGQAAEYRCKGVDRADGNKKVELELNRVGMKKATFVDQEGDEHELDLHLRSLSVGRRSPCHKGSWVPGSWVPGGATIGLGMVGVRGQREPGCRDRQPNRAYYS